MSESASPLAANLRAQLALAPGERLYGIVDAAQDAALAEEAQRRFGDAVRTLFQGEAAQYLNHVAPHVVPVPIEDGFLDSWAQRWGKNVGILLTTSAAPRKLFHHLRKVFIVQDEEKQEYFFRYYDPRVLRAFLPTCTAAEREDFFGPVRSLLVEGDPPEVLWRFTNTPAGLQREGLALETQ